MRRLAMLILVAIMLTVGSVAVGYAEPPDPCRVCE